MYIKNNSSTDLNFQVKGSKYVLKAGEVTTIPDGVITLAQLSNMFGKGVIQEVETGVDESLLANQVEVEAGILYCTDGSVGLGNPRLFVGLDGSVNVYGSDSKTIPASVEDMALPEENEDVSGLRVFGALPRYIAFMYTSGEPEIILTNCKLVDIGEI